MLARLKTRTDGSNQAMRGNKPALQAICLLRVFESDLAPPPSATEGAEGQIAKCPLAVPRTAAQ